MSTKEKARSTEATVERAGQEKRQDIAAFPCVYSITNGSLGQEKGGNSAWMTMFLSC